MEEVAKKAAKSTSAPTMGSVGARGAKVDPKGTSGGTLIKKKHGKSVDPAPNKGGKPSRSNKLRPTTHDNRDGATYKITASFPRSVAPEASAIQGNGRIIASAINRSRQNFKSGMMDLD
jgi:hypothetical protein